MPLSNPYNCHDYSLTTWTPQYEQEFDVGHGISVITAYNPSAMTLQGTNTWIIHLPSGTNVVIDPGPDDPAHINAVAQSCGTEPLILITHHHRDHTAGAAPLAELTGGTVQAYSYDSAGSPGKYYGRDIIPGDNILRNHNAILYALSTPGHTNDSLCFIYLDSNDENSWKNHSFISEKQSNKNNVFNRNNDDLLQDNHHKDGATIVFTGDTLLGHGSTILLSTPNALHHYLQSLITLGQLPQPAYTAPGHGLWGEILHRNCGRNYQHRISRLTQLRTELEKRSICADQADPVDLTRSVYSDIPDTLFSAAAHNVTIQLEYLVNNKNIIDELDW